MKYLNHLFFPLLMSLLTTGLLTAQDGESNQGALILISTEGKVRYLDEKETQQEDIKIGSIIPSSYLVETGGDGKLTGLLSNGTLLTLTENTRMKVATFEQEPFEDDGRKLADLPGEPSRSKVDIELQYGSLVVKTKKLSKGSNFTINSPLGGGHTWDRVSNGFEPRAGCATGCDRINRGLHSSRWWATHPCESGRWA